MFDFLEGFEKRMEFVAVVESIVKRKNTNLEIESWFDDQELDNLFFSLLVYIMEQTLSENDDCTMENITRFIDDILPQYGKDFTYDKVAQLAEYMIKDILQNKGVGKSYGVMNYEKGLKEIRVRLISDKINDEKKIIYQLTDQGYDFLFRTKEVDKELDFKLEQLKLKELLKRKNYKQAMRQSKDLISMLRQKKRELEEFIDRIRQNIHEIDRADYEKLLKETYALIDEEYEGMNEIKLGVDQDEIRINKEFEDSNYMDETMQKALDSLAEIKRNIQLVIVEQRNLIGKRFGMNDIYEETIRNSFLSSIVKRFDFEKEILLPLEAAKEEDISSFWKLMTPLCMPRLKKQLNLSLLYQRQSKLKEVQDEVMELEEEELEEDQIEEQRKFQNEIHYSIVAKIFKYAQKTEKAFTFSQIYHHIELNSNRLSAYTKDRRIFLSILKLYEIHILDMEIWKDRNKEEVLGDANGEFDLAWCLYQLEQRHPDYYGVKKISIEKSSGKTFEVEIEEEVGEEKLKSKISMDDFVFQPEFFRLGDVE